jgi:hypothetical protein
VNRPLDPRITALATFLRQRAAAFSLSADVNNAEHTARAGMALLDAALLVEAMLPDDPTLRALSEAGCFEPMPQNLEVFVATPEVHRVLRSPLAGNAQDAQQILSHIVSAARQR